MKRGPGDQQLGGTPETLERLVKLRLVILKPMRLIHANQPFIPRSSSSNHWPRTYLIHSQDLPLDLLQILSILENELIRRKKDVELQILQWSKFKLSNDVSRSGRTHITNDVQFGRPPFELGLPSGDGR